MRDSRKYIVYSIYELVIACQIRECMNRVNFIRVIAEDSELKILIRIKLLQESRDHNDDRTK